MHLATFHVSGIFTLAATKRRRLPGSRHRQSTFPRKGSQTGPTTPNNGLEYLGDGGLEYLGDGGLEYLVEDYTILLLYLILLLY